MPSQTCNKCVLEYYHDSRALLLEQGEQTDNVNYGRKLVIKSINVGFFNCRIKVHMQHKSTRLSFLTC